MTWALELRAMPNNTSHPKRLLAGWLLAGCLSAPGLTWAQEAAQEPDAPIPGDSERERPPISAPEEGAAPAPPKAQTDPGAILDYEPSESISEDLSVSFPVDI